MDELIDGLAKSLGLEGTSLLAALAALSLICRLIGKAIPDDATGWKGIVRKVTKVIGLYTSNRITSGVSVTDVAKKTVHEFNLVDEIQQDKPDDQQPTVKPFPGVGLILMLCLSPMLLMGCTTTGTAALSQVRPALHAVCDNREVLALAILQIQNENVASKAEILIRGLERACPLLFPDALALANDMKRNG